MAREERFDKGKERGLGQEMILGVVKGKMALWRLGCTIRYPWELFFFSAATSIEDCGMWDCF